jgi:hypothetical protein
MHYAWVFVLFFLHDSSNHPPPRKKLESREEREKKPHLLTDDDRNVCDAYGCDRFFFSSIKLKKEKNKKYM